MNPKNIPEEDKIYRLTKSRMSFVPKNGHGEDCPIIDRMDATGNFGGILRVIIRITILIHQAQRNLTKKQLHGRSLRWRLALGWVPSGLWFRCCFIARDRK